jgi:negative regulator of flagellin synthesis FlgM
VSDHFASVRTLNFWCRASKLDDITPAKHPAQTGMSYVKQTIHHDADSNQPGTPALRSDELRTARTGGAQASRSSSAGELSAERIAEVREKILSGAYNSLEVVDQVARRILVSGDV